MGAAVAVVVVTARVRGVEVTVVRVVLTALLTRPQPKRVGGRGDKAHGYRFVVISGAIAGCT